MFVIHVFVSGTESQNMDWGNIIPEKKKKKKRILMIRNNIQAI